MDQPWGVGGPAFVGLYIGMLVVPAVVGMLWDASLRRAGSQTPGHTDQDLPTIYHIAYLAGGTERATETALARMLDDEQIRIDSSGRVSAIESKRPDDEFEQSLARKARITKVRSLKASMRNSSAMGRLVTDLELRGLLVPRAKRRQVWRTILLVYVVVLATGVVRWINGVSLDYPVGYLSALLVVAAVACVVTGSLPGKKAVDGTPSRSGTAHLERLRREHAASGDLAGNVDQSPHSASARGSHYQRGAMLAGVGGMVALGGVTLYPDEEVSQLLAQPAFAPSTGGGWSSGGGYACSSGGSSCSSGGGGGSSCGGGGGGGGGCGGGGGG